MKKDCKDVNEKKLEDTRCESDENESIEEDTSSDSDEKNEENNG